MHRSDTPSRRDFFKAAGVAGSALAFGSVIGKPGRAAEAMPPGEKKLPFPLGLASYTLRKFDLDQTLAMTKRVGLTHICLKSFHLPLDATAAQADRPSPTVEPHTSSPARGDTLSRARPRPSLAPQIKNRKILTFTQIEPLDNYPKRFFQLPPPA